MPAPLETQGTPLSAAPVTTGVSGEAIAHDSAERHVQGAAIYIDDMREPDGTVHVVPGYAAAAPAAGSRSWIWRRSAPPMASSPC